MSGAAEASARSLSFVDPATFTPHFSWKQSAGSSEREQIVACEGVPLINVAEKIGTPTYLYSRTAIDDAQRELHRGLGALPHTLCFAVKSNGNLAMLKHVAKMGSGFDIVSGGELHLLRRIGVRGDRIVFSGVGKTREELREALRYSPRGGGGHRGILLFNVESEAELEVLLEESARQSRRGGLTPAVSIRVNPDVQAGGHPHIGLQNQYAGRGSAFTSGRRSSHWIRFVALCVAWLATSRNCGKRAFRSNTWILAEVWECATRGKGLRRAWCTRAWLRKWCGHWVYIYCWSLAARLSGLRAYFSRASCTQKQIAARPLSWWMRL